MLRPFPFKDESLRGYLHRIARENGFSAPSQAFSPSQIDAFAPSAFAETASHAEVLNLGGIVPKSEGCGGLLSNTKGLSIRFWNTSYARVCPACLVESTYFRASWELAFVVACPVHAIKLVDTCPSCQQPLRWQRNHPEHCDCGASLKCFSPEAAHHGEERLAAALSEMLNRGHATALPDHLIHLGIEDLNRLIWFIGGYAERHGDAKPLKIDGIYRLEVVRPLVIGAAEVLLDWPAGFHRFLSRLGEFNYKDTAASSRLLKQFGYFYHTLYKSFGDSQFTFLHQAFENFLKENWTGALNRRHRWFSPTLLENQSQLPLPKAAKELNLSRTTIKKLIADGKLSASIRELPSGRRITVVERESVDHYFEFQKSLISFDEARKLLGLSKKKFKMLLNEGLIKAETGPSVDGRSIWGFSKEIVKLQLSVCLT